jgi:hypothetical protein
MSDLQELKAQFNIRERIEESNLKIERWNNWKRNIGKAELVYIAHPTYDIWIRGIHPKTDSALTERLAQFKLVVGAAARDEFIFDFIAEFDYPPQSLLAKGYIPKDSKEIDSIIKKKCNLTDDEFDKLQLQTYDAIINELHYTSRLLIIKRIKTYKPISYV